MAFLVCFVMVFFPPPTLSPPFSPRKTTDILLYKGNNLTQFQNLTFWKYLQVIFLDLRDCCFIFRDAHLYCFPDVYLKKKFSVETLWKLFWLSTPQITVDIRRQGLEDRIAVYLCLYTASKPSCVIISRYV